MSTSPSFHTAQPGSVAVVGAGNIGSQLLPLVARMPAVACVTIVDHDSYEEKNRASQAITPADVGRPKAVVQAERLRGINPGLRVTALVERVENVPAGALRAAVVAGCLDSRGSRRFVNRIAWRLGVPFVDAGVQPDGMLARVHVYRPEPAGVCLECLWTDEDYAAERERYACDGTPAEAAATNAPVSLGALTAALQAVEVEKVLAGDWARVAVGHEVLLAANSHRYFLTRLPRNGECRFDHRTIVVRQFSGPPDTLTLADLFGAGAEVLRVEGQAFASRWACAACRTAGESFGLRDRLVGSVMCPRCGGAMRAMGFHTHDRLTAADVPAGLISVPLATLGFRRGDIFSTAGRGGESHYEIPTQKGESP